VFMQNEQLEDGTMRPLDMQSIDTGMGLERIGALMQGHHDNYDTDLMRALIEASAHATSVEPDGNGNTHHRVIADHLRSTSFLIAEGVLPSNEGRGYVLRRIMRRAMRHAHLLGATDPVMHKLVPELVKQMGAAYPELGQGQRLIEETLLNEEIRFKTTLDRGLKLLDDEVSGLAEGADLPGAAAFKLYDTFGFPLDLTQDALREKGFGVDKDGFESAMAEQKAKARAAWTGTGAQADASVWFDVVDQHGTTDFLGYENLSAEGQIVALIVDGQAVSSANGEVQIALNQSPFYAESGGQVGDAGFVTTETGKAKITDTKKVAGVFLHIGQIIEGEIKIGQGAALAVDVTRRAAIQANHTATHLLNEALRTVLGNHIAQKGSLNAPDRLRFDFSSNSAVSVADLDKVEREVNALIRQNTAVDTRIMTPDDARGLGAQALFGEKYGDEVRVVSMGQLAGSGKGADESTYSLELCGGTHVTRLGEIGAFVMLGDSASSAGVRRIEALTGQAALDYLREQDQRLVAVANVLKAPAADVADRVKALMDERKSLVNDVAQLRRELAMGSSGTDAAIDEAVNGIRFVGKLMAGLSGKDLPSLVDQYKSEIGSGVVLLIGDAGGKAAIATGVTQDLTDKLSAVDVLRAAVPLLGGKGGGGRPDMAQGGGASADNADAAIAAAKTFLEEL
jgi:alanyl-tRNA synthetase